MKYLRGKFIEHFVSFNLAEKFPLVLVDFLTPLRGYVRGTDGGHESIFRRIQDPEIKIPSVLQLIKTKISIPQITIHYSINKIGWK